MKLVVTCCIASPAKCTNWDDNYAAFHGSGPTNHHRLASFRPPRDQHMPGPPSTPTNPTHAHLDPNPGVSVARGTALTVLETPLTAPLHQRISSSSLRSWTHILTDDHPCSTGPHAYCLLIMQKSFNGTPPCSSTLLFHTYPPSDSLTAFQVNYYSG
jgi:hypothetical protein